MMSGNVDYMLIYVQNGSCLQVSPHDCPPLLEKRDFTSPQWLPSGHFFHKNLTHILLIALWVDLMSQNNIFGQFNFISSAPTDTRSITYCTYSIVDFLLGGHVLFLVNAVRFEFGGWQCCIVADQPFGPHILMTRYSIKSSKLMGGYLVCSYCIGMRDVSNASQCIGRLTKGSTRPHQ